MGGGLMQLVAYGSQDVYLTGDPQITFWKIVYRRYTNFAVESIRQTFNKNDSTYFGLNADCIVSRTGDLVHKCHIEMVFQLTKPHINNNSHLFGVPNSTPSTNRYIIPLYENTDDWYKASQLERQLGYSFVSNCADTGANIGNSFNSDLNFWGDITNNFIDKAMILNNDASSQNRNDFKEARDAFEDEFNRYFYAIKPDVCYNVIDYIEFDVGGQTIDKHTGKWLKCWKELTTKEEHKDGMKNMTGANKTIYLRDFKGDTDNKKHIMYLPLEFFFCQSAGLALPLIALQYHESKIRVGFNKSENIALPKLSSGEWSGHITFTPNIYIDYIFLDTDERRKMAQTNHQFLITQLEYDIQEIPTGTKNFKLNFNHPIKELIWYVENSLDQILSLNDDNKINLVLNGQDRFSKRHSNYFLYMQNYQYHTRIPSKKIYTYSFSLNPEDPIQPNGSCNFSRIDFAQLEFDKNLVDDGSDCNLCVFAPNWNIFRVMSGMGGLAYSN